MNIYLHPRWLERATVGLNETLHDDLPLLKTQVNRGIAQLWEIETDKGTSWMISRVEIINGKRELVICCYQGCDVKTVTRVIYRCAQVQGFDSIRYHTQRQGLNRLVVDLGFTPYETIYRKTLTEAP
ncbi:MAG: hypothetical protein KTR20_14135 [Cellvibrionaceae bacterium]|nr:hypothetical protein [Cellvibrionaceae bacterium]